MSDEKRRNCPKSLPPVAFMPALSIIYGNDPGVSRLRIVLKS
jgi:hypothetical protein